MMTNNAEVAVSYLRLCLKMTPDVEARAEAEERLSEIGPHSDDLYNVLRDELVSESCRERAASRVIECSDLTLDEALALVPIAPASLSWEVVDRARQLGASLSELFDAARSLHDEAKCRRLEFMSLVAVADDVDDTAVNAWVEYGADLDDLVTVARANRGEASERAGEVVLHSDGVTEQQLTLLSGDDVASPLIRCFAPLVRQLLVQEAELSESEWKQAESAA